MTDSFKLASNDRASGECTDRILQSFGLIVFGASGDLTQRRLIPALYRLFRNNLLPQRFFVLGVSRSALNSERFRELLEPRIQSAFPKDYDEASWQDFAERLSYESIDYALQETYTRLLEGIVPSLRKEYGVSGHLIFYLAIPPTLYEDVLLHLGASVGEGRGSMHPHVVIEKPFGRDLDSARRLNRLLRRFFSEDRIYRIDHYLGLETVQSLLMFRFANSIFEPLWNRRYVDHIQITASETVGVEHRAGYYEEAGVIRDMFQNHIFQLLALSAMEPPVTFEAQAVRVERAKALASVRAFPLDRLEEFIAVGQYGGGEIRGTPVSAYREEPGVRPASTTATFAAMKVLIDNWRWNGVPFYLRSGKRLRSRKTEVSIHFKPVPHLMFSKALDQPIEPNVLVLRIQPDEGISLFFQTKKPESKICLKEVRMDFTYEKELLMDAYEWVLLGCILGDQMLFLSEAEVERSWALLTPVIERLESTIQPDRFPNYAAGTSGPEEARVLIERDGRRWRPL